MGAVSEPPPSRACNSQTLSRERVNPRPFAAFKNKRVALNETKPMVHDFNVSGHPMTSEVIGTRY